MGRFVPGGTSFAARRFTSNATPSYTYNGAFCGNIYLSLFCNGGSNAGKSHCMCNTTGVTGCIVPGAGWGP